MDWGGLENETATPAAEPTSCARQRCHRHAVEVKRLCDVVQNARSSFNAWRPLPSHAARAVADAELANGFSNSVPSMMSTRTPRSSAVLDMAAELASPHRNGQSASKLACDLWP